MSKTKHFQRKSALWLFSTVIAGAACARWIPSEWFLSVLDYSILAAMILAVLATLNLKNERHPKMPIALMLEALWLPSRNGEIKLGAILWAFLGATGFVCGMLVCALLLSFLI